MTSLDAGRGASDERPRPAADLREWCRIPVEQLADHPLARVPFRLVRDSAEMVAGRELADLVAANEAEGRPTGATSCPAGRRAGTRRGRASTNGGSRSRASRSAHGRVPRLAGLGPAIPTTSAPSWRRTSTAASRGPPGARAPAALAPALDDRRRARGDRRRSRGPHAGRLGPGRARGLQPGAPPPVPPSDAGGYSRPRRSACRRTTSTRFSRSPTSVGAAFQFVPPMSVTLGLRECLSARKVRVFSDTGAWKHALRVALFSEPTPNTR